MNGTTDEHGLTQMENGKWRIEDLQGEQSKQQSSRR